jgi:hypothetical protein
MAPFGGAVGPAYRLRRRYADAPAAALLTGLGAALGPVSRLRRRYADAPAGAFFLVAFATATATRIDIDEMTSPAFAPQIYRLRARTWFVVPVLCDRQCWLAWHLVPIKPQE